MTTSMSRSAAAHDHDHDRAHANANNHDAASQGAAGGMTDGVGAADLAAELRVWQQWVGRTERRDDQASAAPLAGLSATLDRDDPEPLPGTDIAPLAHWMYFLPRVPQHAIGPDGHARRGDFLPPVPLPRRMWAGGRLEFRHPLQVGEDISRSSRILKVDAKRGRSGPLVFVTVRHEVANGRGVAIVEDHDIVYREAARPGDVAPTPETAPTDSSFERRIVPDPVMLFRYSALTFNGHRIHYDRSYVTQEEGYPGLIVHGPLIATLLLDLLRRERPGARVKRFSFTALKPVFDLHAFEVCGRDEGGSRFPLWTRDHEGHLTMRAEAITE